MKEQTLGDFLCRCDSYHHSREYFNFMKECAEYDLKMIYLENQKFVKECNAEAFEEGYFIEATSEDQIHAIEEAAVGQAKAIAGYIKKRFLEFLKAIRTFFAGILKKFGYEKVDKKSEEDFQTKFNKIRDRMEKDLEGMSQDDINKMLILIDGYFDLDDEHIMYADKYYPGSTVYHPESVYIEKTSCVISTTNSVKLSDVNNGKIPAKQIKKLEKGFALASTNEIRVSFTDNNSGNVCDIVKLANILVKYSNLDINSPSEGRVMKVNGDKIKSELKKVLKDAASNGITINFNDAEAINKSKDEIDKMIAEVKSTELGASKDDMEAVNQLMDVLSATIKCYNSVFKMKRKFREDFAKFCTKFDNIGVSTK